MNKLLQQRLDKKYQAEMVDEYFRLCAGGKPLVNLDIDKETWDNIEFISRYRGITRRQVMDLIVEEYAIPEIEANKKLRKVRKRTNGKFGKAFDELANM